jgi:hypothetical protein
LTKTLKSSLLRPEGAALFERHPPHFSTAVYTTLLAGPDWLDDATKTIGQHWKRKNAQRHGLCCKPDGTLH